MSDNVLQLSVDKFYTQALPCIVQDIKAENPLILEKIEFGEDYEVAILMNTRNKLIEWLEAEDDTQTYSELDLDSYVLELANDASLTECVHEDKGYNPTLLREQINSISSLIKQKICDEIYTKMCIKMWIEYVLKHVLK